MMRGTTYIPNRFTVLLVTGLTLAAFGFVPKVGFMWDDGVLLLNNPAVHAWSGAAISRDFTAPTYPDGGHYYRPVQLIVLRSLWTVFRDHPMGYHVVTLLLQAGCGILTAALALALGLSAPLAGLSGCFLAVHPIIVDEMMPATEIHVLTLFLFLAALLLLIHDRRRMWVVFGLPFAAAALFAKESSIVLPLLFGLLLYVRRSPRSFYLRLLPVLVIALIYWVLRERAVGQALPGPVKESTIAAIKVLPAMIMTAARLIIWPAGLLSYRWLVHPSAFWGLRWAVILAVGVWAWKRQERWPFFCWCWFVLLLAPTVVAFLENGNMVDHWAYAPAVGLYIPAAWLVGRWRKESRWRWQGLVLSAGLLLGAIVVSQWNVYQRGSDEKNYRWNLRAYQPAFIRYRLAALLANQGRWAEALPYFEDLYREDPQNESNVHSYFLALWNTGSKAKAFYVRDKFVSKAAAKRS